jgi:YARHG domain-containing protein
VRWLVTSMIVLAATTGAAPASTREICHSLWVERAAIYKDAGLCFKTARAINYFGNAGCRYDDEADVPLTPREIARLEKLLAQERANRCDGWWW